MHYLYFKNFGEKLSLKLNFYVKFQYSFRSEDTPHIKWLKQVSQDALVTSEANILNVRDNRYQILPTAKDIKVNKDEYVNILSLDDVTEADNGTYICFVAKNGLNSLTFKSATVFVIPGILHTCFVCVNSKEIIFLDF